MELALDHPWLVALALVALPLVLGASLGAALRRWTRRPVPAGVALAAAALAGAWAALPWLPEVSPYDVLGVAATFAAALAVAARRPLERVPRAVLGASASVAVLGLAALELGARALPPPPMGMSPQARQALTVPLERRSAAGPLAAAGSVALAALSAAWLARGRRMRQADGRPVISGPGGTLP